MFLLALSSVSFASGPIAVLGALLLIDIGNTFGTSVSVTGQINTAYSIAAVFFALLTGVLSIRFKHKSLLLVGVLLMIVSALGCFIAPDFITLLAFYSLSGAGYAIVNPMTFTLVGEHFPLKSRANAIGWVVAGGALVYVVGAPTIAAMSGYRDWRFPLPGFVLPILLMSLLLAFLGLPSTPRSDQARSDAGFKAVPKRIFLNRSAVACLIGDTLRSAAFVAVVLYAISFYRQRFLIPTDSASLILLGGALSYVLGSLCTGRLVNRFGRKMSTVLTALLSGTFTISYVLVPNIWVSVMLMLVASWFFGMVASSANSLTLEQIPELKGTLMSIDTAVLNIGSAFGSVIGGLVLLYLGYEGLGSVLGVVGMAAAMVYYMLTKDPTKPK
jgi:predicted MFS family arabinose efflux permease